MTDRKKSSYKAKFNGGTSYTYTHRKCGHNNVHLEHAAGRELTICNACNTIRSNQAAKRKTPAPAVLLKAA